jgi:predicted HAD superfamily Cof-like phosphohydrolase
MSENLSKTNFELVGDFHEVFGHPKPNVLQKNIILENPKLTELRINLIGEEFRELKEAVAENNMVEVIDALADILYVVYGMGQAFGIDLDKAFKIVHDSNMSKLCKNEQEAIDSVEHYKTLPEFKNLNIQYRKSDKVDGYYVIFNADTGKILKSKYFNLPDFSSMFSGDE